MLKVLFLESEVNIPKSILKILKPTAQLKQRKVHLNKHTQCKMIFSLYV